MNTAAHTPGPWKMKPDGFSISVFAESRPNIAVSIVGKGGRVSEERDANACLIAAAPDLLAACKNCMENRGDWAASMADAIAKAVGGGK